MIRHSCASGPSSVNVDLRKASELNLGQMNHEMEALCASQVPGNTHRDLRVQARRAFKHILVPVWLVNYTFGSKTFQVLSMDIREMSLGIDRSAG
jgi:hypothetical protein